MHCTRSAARPRSLLFRLTVAALRLKRYQQLGRGDNVCSNTLAELPKSPLPAELSSPLCVRVTGSSTRALLPCRALSVSAARGGGATVGERTSTSEMCRDVAQIFMCG
eukprot:scaffold112124_cov60-Phaeocystis_antarctica.AAC.1